MNKTQFFNVVLLFIRNEKSPKCQKHHIAWGKQIDGVQLKDHVVTLEDVMEQMSK